jgi:hypothetical protein
MLQQLIDVSPLLSEILLPGALVQYNPETWNDGVSWEVTPCGLVKIHQPEIKIYGYGEQKL